MQLTVVFIFLVFAIFSVGRSQVSTTVARRNSRLENILLLRRKQVGLLPKKLIFERPRQTYEDEQEEYEDEEDDDEEAEVELHVASGIAEEEGENDETDDAEGEEDEYDDEQRKFDVEARIFVDKDVKAEGGDETASKH